MTFRDALSATLLATVIIIGMAPSSVDAARLQNGTLTLTRSPGVLPPSGGTVVFSGRLTFPQPGRRTAGVRLKLRQTDWYAWHAQDAPGQDDLRTRTLRTMTTDARGRFRVRIRLSHPNTFHVLLGRIFDPGRQVPGAAAHVTEAGLLSRYVRVKQRVDLKSVHMATRHGIRTLNLFKPSVYYTTPTLGVPDIHGQIKPASAMRGRNNRIAVVQRPLTDPTRWNTHCNFAGKHECKPSRDGLPGGSFVVTGAPPEITYEDQPDWEPMHESEVWTIRPVLWDGYIVKRTQPLYIVLPETTADLTPGDPSFGSADDFARFRGCRITRPGGRRGCRHGSEVRFG